MQILTTVDAMRCWSAEHRAAGRRIGFVPTMGYLHEGHLALVREAARQADVVVVSVYVNPTQFGPTEDLDRYPRDLARDQRLLEGEGVDALFLPPTSEMYPAAATTFVTVEGSLTRGLCGATRPGHFRGVATIVAKLFVAVQPHVAVFGLKDYQQFRVIARLTSDLLLDVRLVGFPTVREPDGLAMSSRNVFLSPDERARALALPRGLTAAAAALEGGAEPGPVTGRLWVDLAAAGGRPDYLTVADADSLVEIGGREPGRRVVLAAAVFFGRTRLIDNIVATMG
jgi:pantoate--beta-alanine ligase